MEKINIAELLKDCPKGTKLYSPLVGECTLEHIHGELKKILISTSDGTTLTFNNNGTYFKIGNSECLLFPSKNQRDWSKFQRPFKDGDIVFYNDTIAIFKEWTDETMIEKACEWLSKALDNFYIGTQQANFTDKVKFIESFKKAMRNNYGRFCAF